MKLRRESSENGDFSGPKGEFKKLFSELKSYRDTSWQMRVAVANLLIWRKLRNGAPITWRTLGTPRTLQ